MNAVYVLLLATFINGHDDWYMVEDLLPLDECRDRVEELEVHLGPNTQAVCELKWID